MFAPLLGAVRADMDRQMDGHSRRSGVRFDMSRSLA
jgi:hypothetical protein